MVGTVKKKYIYVLGTAFALCLVALVAVGSLEARTRYYTPVVSSAGDKIAYVKVTTGFGPPAEASFLSWAANPTGSACSATGSSFV